MEDDQNTADSTTQMLACFAGVTAHLEELEGRLTALPSSARSPETLKQAREAFFCLRLAMTFYVEANQAIRAGAWFAAATVAAAALESILLAKCFLQQAEIKALPKWKAVKKSQRDDFGLFVRGLDLGKLLDIASQLSWFPSNGVPTTFLVAMEPYWEVTTKEEFLALFNSHENVGHVCATHLREYRNLVHPSVCLKEGQQPTPETGITATFMFMIAVSSLSGGTIS